MTRSPAPLLLALLTATALAAQLPQAPPPVASRPSPERLKTIQSLRRDAAAPRHSSDGGGKAWLVGRETGEAVPEVEAATAHGWAVLFEAGPEGVAVGGSVFLYIPTAWSWSPPQLNDPAAPGYVRVTPFAPQAEFQVGVNPAKMYVRVRVQGRGLAAGERLRFDYGAGEARALVDRFAERGSRFWLAVDGDGDGIQKLLPDSPTVDIVAGPPSRLVLTVPSTARPGESVRLTTALLDRFGNAGRPVTGEIRLELPPELEGPEVLELAPHHGGRRQARITVPSAGVYRLRATALDGLTATSNPLWVSPEAPRLRWADLQGHSASSDGTGTPEDYLIYARDIAGLDAVALTDHDHWGRPFLDQRPAAWREIVEQTRSYHRPDHFVTLLGYEWTSWVHGHRHVLYFGDDGPLLSNIDPRFESPSQLWAGLADSGVGTDAATIAHHSAGGPIETDWSVPPDPRFESVVEVVSIHGSSEAPDSPIPIYKPVAGHWVRDALDRGYHLGLIGSGDSHDGHPGLSHIASRSGGLAALYSDRLTREGIRETLARRHTYATNGARIFLHTELDGLPMGSVVTTEDTLPADATSTEDTEPPEHRLTAFILATSPLARVDLIRDGRILETVPGGGRLELRLDRALPATGDGYLYLRVVQEDEGAAWSSPYFFE